jgi:hypothetical protein
MRVTLSCYRAWREPTWSYALIDVAGRLQRDREYVWQISTYVGECLNSARAIRGILLQSLRLGPNQSKRPLRSQPPHPLEMNKADALKCYSAMSRCSLLRVQRYRALVISSRSSL